LLEALDSGHLAGAGLDVTHPEPLPTESALWRLPNVIITPHCSALSPNTAQRFADILVENLGRFQRSEPLINIVDKRRGY
jgi:phosphoglycerate dehydrogenase-like enzyme